MNEKKKNMQEPDTVSVESMDVSNEADSLSEVEHIEEELLAEQVSTRVSFLRFAASSLVCRPARD